MKRHFFRVKWWFINNSRIYDIIINYTNLISTERFRFKRKERQRWKYDNYSVSVHDNMYCIIGGPKTFHVFCIWKKKVDDAPLHIKISYLARRQGRCMDKEQHTHTAHMCIHAWFHMHCLMKDNVCVFVCVCEPPSGMCSGSMCVVVCWCGGEGGHYCVCVCVCVYRVVQ